MWNSTAEILQDERAERFLLSHNQSLLTNAEVFKHWQDDETFRAFFTDLLVRSRFAAFKWETPPVTSSSLNHQFEFVLLDTPALDRAPDSSSFASQFRSCKDATNVISFANLGGDAVMIVPRRQGRSNGYAHLAGFLRNAPTTQTHELWSVIGAEMSARCGTRPLWLSTAGMGVPWLHVRIDSRPKYYGYEPYTKTK